LARKAAPMTLRPTSLGPVAVAGLVAVCACLGWPYPADAGGRSGKHVFVGGLSAPGDRVRLTVRLEDGRPVSGRYHASRVFFSCEEGSRRVSLGPIRVRFRGKSFEAETYHAGGPAGPERYLRIEGRMRKGGRKANGFVYAYTDPPDDDPARACGTEVLMGWKAFRRR
jgi:hypothetical protein